MIRNLRRRVRLILSLTAGAPLAACGYSQSDWASRDEIIEAAERCGIRNFEPTKAGAAWAAYVGPDVPDHKTKEDCIYDDLQGRGRFVTR